MNNNKINNIQNDEKEREILLRDILDEAAIMNLVNTDKLTHYSRARRKKLLKEGIDPNIKNNKEELKYIKKLIDRSKSD
jgi:phosphoribosyl-AMP cyclohydrolase